MAFRKRGYVICAPSPEHFHHSLEQFFYEQKSVEALARRRHKEVVYDLVNPNGIVTAKDHAKRLIVLSQIRLGEFTSVLLKGERATPYVGAILKAAYHRIEIINEATKNSQLDFCIEMHRLDFLQRQIARH